MLERLMSSRYSLQRSLFRWQSKDLYRKCHTKSNSVIENGDRLSHVHETKNVPRMVDIAQKSPTHRQAQAQVSISCNYSI